MNRNEINSELKWRILGLMQFIWIGRHYRSWMKVSEANEPVNSDVIHVNLFTLISENEISALSFRVCR